MTPAPKREVGLALGRGGALLGFLIPGLLIDSPIISTILGAAIFSVCYVVGEGLAEGSDSEVGFYEAQRQRLENSSDD